MGTGVLFGGSSDFSRLAEDWDRAIVSAEDDTCSVGWRRMAGDSAGTAGEQAAASLESVSISKVNTRRGSEPERSPWAVVVVVLLRFVVAGGAVVGVVTGIAGAWEEGLTLAASENGKGDGG